MSTSNVLKSTLLLIVIILVVACVSKQKIIENEPEMMAQSKLLFVNYMIRKTVDGKKNITLINQKTTEGTLKSKAKINSISRFGDLEYSTLDKDFHEIEKQSIKNPLIKIVEYINDLGNFEKRIIDIDSAQFYIRLQMQSNVKYIRISELTQEGMIKHITTEIK